MPDARGATPRAHDSQSISKRPWAPPIPTRYGMATTVHGRAHIPPDATGDPPALEGPTPRRYFGAFYAEE
eukprot:8841356-Pyramimonas_sp.AAC.1